MTDFFAELEGQLHATARRRARRDRLRPLVAAVAVAAVAGLAVVTVAGSGEEEREAVPAVATSAPSCGPGIDLLRTPAGDPVPSGIRSRVEQDFPGEGRPLEIDYDGARLAGGRHWVVPVRFASGCGVVVITEAEGTAGLPAWGTYEELGAHGLNLLAGTPSVWLVPNGPAPRLKTRSGTIAGTVRDNVFTADGQGELAFATTKYEDAPACATEPQLTDDPVPDPLLRQFAILRDDDHSGRGSQADTRHLDGVQQIFVRGMRVRGSAFVIPVLLGCDADHTEPGMCLIAVNRKACAAIGTGGDPFLLSVANGHGTVEVVALVSDEPGTVVIGDNRISSMGNLTTTKLPGENPDDVTVRLP
jgi:hypothetical protein